VGHIPAPLSVTGARNSASASLSSKTLVRPSLRHGLGKDQIELDRLNPSAQRAGKIKWGKAREKGVMKFAVVQSKRASLPLAC